MLPKVVAFVFTSLLSLPYLYFCSFLFLFLSFFFLSLSLYSVSTSHISSSFGHNDEFREDFIFTGTGSDVVGRNRRSTREHEEQPPWAMSFEYYNFKISNHSIAFKQIITIIIIEVWKNNDIMVCAHSGKFK